MIHVYHDICLDFQRLEYPRLIRVREGGNGLHQNITVHLFSDGMPENTTGHTFSLHWKKGDGTTGDSTLDAACDGHKVTFELPREILVGNPEVNVFLHIQKGNDVLHSFSFRLYVSQDISTSQSMEIS